MLYITLQRYQFVYRVYIIRFVCLIHEIWLSSRLKGCVEGHCCIKQSCGQMMTDTGRLFEMYEAEVLAHTMSSFLRGEKGIWRGGLGKPLAQYCILLVHSSILDNLQASIIYVSLLIFVFFPFISPIYNLVTCTSYYSPTLPRICDCFSLAHFPNLENLQ